jgi:hypothetical protein
MKGAGPQSEEGGGFGIRPNYPVILVSPGKVGLILPRGVVTEM